MRKLYWAAVYAEERTDCEEKLNELASHHPEGVAYLRKIPPGLWLRHAIDSHYMGFSTNGAAERQVNWFGQQARSEPPVLALKRVLGNLADRREGSWKSR